jgi:hypothetical protein
MYYGFIHACNNVAIKLIETCALIIMCFSIRCAFIFTSRSGWGDNLLFQWNLIFISTTDEEQSQDDNFRTEASTLDWIILFNNRMASNGMEFALSSMKIRKLVHFFFCVFLKLQYKSQHDAVFHKPLVLKYFPMTDVRLWAGSNTDADHGIFVSSQM